MTVLKIDNLKYSLDLIKNFNLAGKLQIHFMHRENMHSEHSFLTNVEHL